MTIKQRVKDVASHVGALVAVAALFALAASSASAEQAHVLTSSFGFTGSATLQRPVAVAVDSSSGPSAGDVYVVDQQGRRIVKFGPAGNFLLTWGKEVNEASADPNHCTNAGPPDNFCQPGVEATGPGTFSYPFAIAVDSSSGPSAGDVYVATDGMVQKFDPSGHLVTGWGGSPFPGAINGSTTPQGSFGNFSAISLDKAGNLYVLESYASRIFKYAPDGSFVDSFVSTGPPSAYGALAAGSDGFFRLNEESGPSSIEQIDAAAADVGLVSGSTYRRALAFDPGRQDLFSVTTDYATEATVQRFHFDGAGRVVQPDSSTCSPAPAPGSGCEATETFGGEDLSIAEGGPSAVAVNEADGTVYVAAPSDPTRGARIEVFHLFDAPKVTTGAVSDLTRTSVELDGHVDPDGAGQVSSCFFEFGKTKARELGQVPCSPGTTATPADVEAALPTGTLAPETIYHYRLVAGNGGGQRPGKDQTFTTPPAVGGVTTGAATNVARLTATAGGSFSGDGIDTSYYFEYGPTTAYGQRTPDTEQGAATGTQVVSATLTQLIAYTTYHYRLVAHNSYGTTFGPDQTLQTLPPELPVVQSTYASTVGAHNAVVNAQIDPGAGLTLYRFDYGTSTSYGSRTLVAGPLDPESADRTASTELTELAPGTTYHYRVLATNFSGTTVGPDQTFTTSSAPVVLSSSVGAITDTSATLSALVNPRLSLSTYRFEYGTGPGYGSRTAEGPGFGPDDAAHSASSALSGLAPGTTYHFRVVATNALGTSYGSDQIFTTTAPKPAAVKKAKGKCKKGFVKKKGKCVRKHAKGKKHSQGKRGKKGGKHA